MEDINETQQDTSLKLADALEQQQRLNEIMQAIQAASTPTQVLEVAIDQVLRLSWLGVRTSAAGFLRRGQQLRMLVSRNMSREILERCSRLVLGQCLCGIAAERGETIVSAHVDEQHTIGYETMADHGHVVLPLRWQAQTLGVMSFYLAAGQVLDDDRQSFLETVASIAATALGRLYFQSQAAQSDRLSSVGLLAAGVAHEINTPLGALLTDVEWLAEDMPPLLEQWQTFQTRLTEEVGRERAKALLEGLPGLNGADSLAALVRCSKSALSAVLRVRDIVRELRVFARSDERPARALQLQIPIESALSMAYNEIKYRAQIIRKFAPTPDVIGHEGRLAQVFLNLLINAAHSIPKGNVEANEIELRTWVSGGEVNASVTDTGSGIDPADLPYLFDPFFTTKEHGVGTGLGLYISNDIICSLGGRIEVESRLGQGTRFIVSLPQAPAAGDSTTSS